MARTSPKNGRQQMATQASVGVDVTRMRKRGRPRFRWMKGIQDETVERRMETLQRMDKNGDREQPR